MGAEDPKTGEAEGSVNYKSYFFQFFVAFSGKLELLFKKRPQFSIIHFCSMFYWFRWVTRNRMGFAVFAQVNGTEPDEYYPL